MQRGENRAIPAIGSILGRLDENKLAVAGIPPKRQAGLDRSQVFVPAIKFTAADEVKSHER